jgi:hypothetical protein
MIGRLNCKYFIMQIYDVLIIIIINKLGRIGNR